MLTKADARPKTLARLPGALASVESEVGVLRRPLLHRPGRELSRLTPRNAAESLYDDVPWPERAAEEHNAFAAVLRRRGIVVDYVGPLLEAALDAVAVRVAAVGAAVAASGLTGPYRDALHAHRGRAFPARMGRRREADHLRRGHGCLGRQADRPHRVAASLVEGGDILVLGSVLVTEVPVARWSIHLDSVVTMIDRDTFLAYPGMAQRLRGFRLQRGAGSRVCVDEGALFDVVARALGSTAVKVLSPDRDVDRAEQEQWNDAYNVLAVAPGAVVAYERNRCTNDYLSSAGIEVIVRTGNGLGRGRGGPRGMSCPLAREPAD